MQDLVGRGREVIVSSLCFENITDCSKGKTGWELGDCSYGRLLSGKNKSSDTPDSWLPPTFSKKGLPNYMKGVISVYQLLLCNKIYCVVEDGGHYKHFQFTP